MSYTPNNPNGSATSANSAPVVIASDQSSIPVAATITGTPTISGSVSVSNFPASQAVTGTFFQATQPVSAASLPLPTGAATDASLATVNTTLGTPFQAGGSIGNSAFGISGSLPAGSNALGSVTVSNFPGTQPISGSVSVSNFPATQAVTGTFFQTTQPVSIATMPTTPVTGTFFQATQPVSAAALPLPTNAAQEAGGNLATLVTNTTSIATSALQTTGNTSLSTIATNTGNIPAKGAATTANSMPVNIASDQTLPTSVPDLYVTGAAAQTAIVNNILTAASGAAATDLTGYRSATVQVVSTGTGGTCIFEGCNDNTNFQAVPVYNQLILTGTAITTAITATASQLIYTLPTTFRYLRLRIVTTITGGSIQAFSRFSQAAWTPPVFQVAQNTAGSLQTTATLSSGTVTTVSTVTNGNLGFPGQTTDVASAALTTTTTTAAFAPTYGNAYQINIPVTVVSGTSPTLDIEVQESRDAGTNWVAVYDFPRITAVGSYSSPMMPSTGNRVRYVQTVSGTTPSFTRAIFRLQESFGGVTFLRQMIDRTINLTSLGSTTAVLQAEQQTKNVQLTINIGAATGAPAVQLQASDDAGASWYSIGSPLTAVASSTVSSTIANVTAQQYRAIVTTAGTGVTAGYTLVRAF